MASVKDFFPTKYLSCSDLAGKDIIVTVDRVEADTFKQDDGTSQIKPVLHFKESGIKALVTNKTNAMMLAALLGDDTDDWSGKRICLYPDVVAFKGKVADTIRVKRAGAVDAAAA